MEPSSKEVDREEAKGLFSTFLCDVGGILIQVDGAWAPLVGRRAEQSVGSSIVSFVDRDFREWLIAAIGLLVTGKKRRISHTGRLAGRPGRRIRLQLSVPPGATGIPTQLCGLMTFLVPRSHQKKTIIALHKKQKSRLIDRIRVLEAEVSRLESLAVMPDPVEMKEASPRSMTFDGDTITLAGSEHQSVSVQNLGIIYTDAAKKIVWANRPLQQLVDRTDLDNLDLDQFFAAIITSRNALAHITRQINRNLGFRIELPDFGSGPEYRTLRIELQPMTDESDHISGFVGVFEDCTAQKDSEVALRVSEEKYRTLAEKSRDIQYVFRLFPIPGFEYLSPSVIDITGYSLESFKADPELSESLMGADDLERLSLENSTEVFLKSYVVEFIAANGKTIWLEHRLSPTFSHAGGLEKLTGIARDVTERMLTTSDLNDTLHYFKAVFDQQEHILMVFDRTSGCIITANPAAGRFFGVSLETLLQKDLTWLLEVMNVDSTLPGSGAFSSAPTTFEGQYRRVSGEIRYVTIYLSPFRSSTRTCVFGAITDITDHYVTSLSKPEDLDIFEQTFEAAPSALLILNPSSQVIRANRRVLDLTGSELEKIVGKNVFEWIIPIDPRVNPGEFFASVETQREHTTDNHLAVAINNRPEPFQLTCTIATDSTDQTQYIIGQLEPLVGRQLVDDRPIAADDHYRMVSHLLSSFGFSYRFSDSSAVTIHWLTDNVEAVLGYSEEQLHQMSWMAGFHPDDVAGFVQAHKELHADHHIEVDFRFLPGGSSSYRWIRLTGTWSRNDLADFIDVQCVGQDITQQKKMTAEWTKAIERAEEMSLLKDTFLTNISHEIRTPLTSILGYSEILADDLSGAQLEFIELIRGSGRRLLNTLSSILELAQLEGKTMDLFPSMFDLTSEVRSILSPFYAQARSRGLDLFFIDPDEKVIPVYLDKTVIQHLFHYLMDNALKFTPKGSITVTLENVEENVILNVKDTGVGISAEFLPHVFEAFKQESKGFSPDIEGCGLGLTVARYLVDLMRGSIEIISEPGKGTEIRVVLPQRIKASILSVVTRDGITYPIKSTIPMQAN